MKKLALFLILCLSFILNVLGLDWGVPDAVRNQLYFSGEDQIKQSIGDISARKVEKSMTEERKSLAGSRFNPIRSYHPDESNFIKAVSNMNPGKLDFNPHYFYYGTLYIYIFAVVLVIGFFTGFIKPTTDILFYFLHPDEIARFYLAGRFVSAVFGVLAVYLTYCIARTLYDEKTGLLSALALCTAPALVINSHYIATDVTMSFFICLALFFSIRILESSELKWYVLGGISAGLAAQTKYNAGLVLLSIPVADFLRRYDEKREMRYLISCWFDKKSLISYLCATGVFLLLNPFIFLTPQEFREALLGGVLRTGPKITSVVNNFVFYVKVLYQGAGFALFLTSIIGIIFAVIRRGKGDILLSFWVITNWIVLLLMSPLGDRHMRYILLILPALLILSASFVAGLKERMGKISGILFSLLIFLPSLLYSLAYDRVFMNENIRTTAGRWIAENIPAGSRIGLRRDPWQYETPPINQRKYILCITTKNPEKAAQALSEQKPDYFIISNAEFYPDSFQTWDELVTGKGYTLIKEFNSPPRIFGIPFNYRNPVDDFIYFYPRIFIYERVAK